MVRQIEKHTVIWFLGAQTVSLFGSLIVQFAVVWYVTLVTESATMLAVSAISGFLPQLAVSVFAGVWIDRYSRKKVIVAADMLTAAATAGLAWQFYLGRESMPVIFAVLVIRALATGVQMPAVNAMLPQLADKNKLMKVNGINAALNSGMMLLAPLAGGVLLNYLSFTAVLLTDIVTAVASVVILLFIKVQPVVKEEQKSSRMKSFGQKMKDGYAFLRKDIFMRRLLLFQFVVLFLISPSAFLNPLLVSTKFGGDVRLLSGAEAVYSLGMVIGGMAAAGLGRRVAKIYLMFAAAAFYGFFMAGLGVVPAFGAYLCINFLAGVSVPCYNTPITTLVQERTEAEMHGRMFGYVQFVTAAALPLGIACFSIPADIYGVDKVFICNGLVCLAVSSLLCRDGGRAFLKG